MMGAGIIISEATPELTNRYTWYKPSTREYYEIVDNSWVKVHNDTNFLTIEVIGKAEIGSLEVAGDVEAGGEVGLDTEVTISGTVLKFSKGILYEVEVE